MSAFVQVSAYSEGAAESSGAGRMLSHPGPAPRPPEHREALMGTFSHDDPPSVSTDLTRFKSPATSCAVHL
jgi:hypothetical protein